LQAALFIEGNRNGYHPTQCYRTISIGALIDELTMYADELGINTPVFLRNDNGYTYGSIGESDFTPGCYDSERVFIDGDDEYDAWLMGEYDDEGDRSASRFAW
jgi:hypothetical protein